MVDSEGNRTELVRISVPVGVTPQRLDRYLGSHPDLRLSRTKVQKLIVEGHVLVNGRTVESKHLLKGEEKIEISIPPPKPSELAAEDIPLDILYEDDHLAVVNKPAGMVTHPAAGNYTGTLVNALLFHFGGLAGSPGGDRPGIVHRLDKNTSGLLVVARTDETYASLQSAIQRRELVRTYVALICGHMKDESGSIDLPIGRSIRDRKKMTVTDVRSREALTHYRLIDRFRSYDLLEVLLQTGRTHQIRVHFSHQGHPLFGDPEYGGRQKWHRGQFGPERPLGKRLLALLDRQALHARKLEFIHPITHEQMSFESELPDDFASVLKLLEAEGK